MSEPSNPRALPYLPQLDGLRAYAVLGVILHHWIVDPLKNPILNRIPFGTGVNLFFVLSGYLITSILLQEKRKLEALTLTLGGLLTSFYLRRALRILPIYYLTLVVLYFVSDKEFLEAAPYFLSYSINLYMVFQNTWVGSASHLWSLAVEVQFYLLWPLLLLMVPSRYQIALCLVVIASALVGKFIFLRYTEMPLGISLFTSSSFDSLGLGALSACLRSQHPEHLARFASKRFLVVSLTLLAVLLISSTPLTDPLGQFFLNPLSSLVYFALLNFVLIGSYGPFWKLCLENRAVVYLGTISYGLYLYHNFAPRIFGATCVVSACQATNFWLLQILYLALTTMLAVLSWHLIEKPLLSLKRYWRSGEST